MKQWRLGRKIVRIDAYVCVRISRRVCTNFRTMVAMVANEVEDGRNFCSDRSRDLVAKPLRKKHPATLDIYRIMWLIFPGGSPPLSAARLLSLFLIA